MESLSLAELGSTLYENERPEQAKRKAAGIERRIIQTVRFLPTPEKFCAPNLGEGITLFGVLKDGRIVVESRFRDFFSNTMCPAADNTAVCFLREKVDCAALAVEPSNDGTPIDDRFLHFPVVGGAEETATPGSDASTTALKELAQSSLKTFLNSTVEQQLPIPPSSPARAVRLPEKHFHMLNSPDKRYKPVSEWHTDDLEDNDDDESDFEDWPWPGDFEKKYDISDNAKPIAEGQYAKIYVTKEKEPGKRFAVKKTFGMFDDNLDATRVCWEIQFLSNLPKSWVQMPTLHDLYFSEGEHFTVWKNLFLRSTEGQSRWFVTLCTVGKTSDFLYAYLLKMPLQNVVLSFFSSAAAFANSVQVAQDCAKVERQMRGQERGVTTPVPLTGRSRAGSEYPPGLFRGRDDQNEGGSGSESDLELQIDQRQEGEENSDRHSHPRRGTEKMHGEDPLTESDTRGSRSSGMISREALDRDEGREERGEGCLGGPHSERLGLQRENPEPLDRFMGGGGSPRSSLPSPEFRGGRGNRNSHSRTEREALNRQYHDGDGRGDSASEALDRLPEHRQENRKLALVCDSLAAFLIVMILSMCVAFIFRILLGGECTGTVQPSVWWVCLLPGCVGVFVYFALLAGGAWLLHPQRREVSWVRSVVRIITV
uniref:Transmembrane protein n=1 Tax=Chromera velia CCMP2878 TaxID=1169474 RepID=A0A0G4H131_9ALVE|eukprot:Cvel_5525.t1-p1 / transcript=Cvel_5525.t1 / gene=Cvel_5525 / organism=Chromera_velia_CCMP2878 / gene_product=hypothetical protein / transcript_product=hypothetical protein / location=Cvel_scaffold259:13162-21335(-) / protein_length=653 / sequence_SO=supercontig / SO=protein_coding / is_pseudo=false